jgi:hypothetical protein
VQARKPHHEHYGLCEAGHEGKEWGSLTSSDTQGTCGLQQARLKQQPGVAERESKTTEGASQPVEV